MKSYWNCDRLFFEDLPTVRDLIWNADWSMLSREVSRSYECDGVDGEAAAIRSSLEEMMDLMVHEPSAKWVFLPFEYYSVGTSPESIERRIDSALVRRADFKAIEKLSRHEELQFTADGCRKQTKRELKRLDGDYPDLHSWSLTAWEKTLSYRVWMQGDYSRKERYQALAAIVEEMLLFGGAYEDARKEQRMVEKRLKREVKLVKKGEVKTNPVELLLRNYGLESSTDDYESEYRSRLEDTVLVLNHNVSVDLHRRIANLANCMKRAEKKNLRSETLSLDLW